MSHRYNLRSRKNITQVIEDKPERKAEIVITTPNTIINKDNFVYGKFKEPLCSNHFKEDLLAFVEKWKELLPNLSDTIIENVKKTDYTKDPYNYLQVNNQLFEKLKNQCVVYLQYNKNLINKGDYESVKTLFNKYMFSEEVTELITKNTPKQSNSNDAKRIKEKIQRQALNDLRKQLYVFS